MISNEKVKKTGRRCFCRVGLGKNTVPQSCFGWSGGLLSTAAPPGAAMELIYQSKPIAPEQPQSVSPWSNTVVGTRMKGW